MREDAEVLVALAKEDEDALLVLEVGGEEDWGVRIGEWGLKGKGEFGEVAGSRDEAGVDEVLHG